ncbi:MAG TPA: lactonase family protein [Cyclobacteriaceae bacterium]|nr:lactonase family protein [Cyclobacteriaceae bacterium]
MKIFIKILTTLSLSFMLASCAMVQEKAPEEFFYFGTFSKQNMPGLFVYNFNRDSARFSLVQAVEHLAGPNFLAVNSDETVLYSVNNESVNDSTRWGSVSAFRIDSISGELTVINDQPSYGSGPCHIAVNEAGTFVAVSNYGSGSLAVIALNEDGSLGSTHHVIKHEGSGPVPSRQNRPHVHSSLIIDNLDMILAADLGTDKIMVYDINRNDLSLQPGKKSFLTSVPGAGPRHMDFNPAQSVLYMIGELSNSVSVYSIAGDSISDMIQHIRALPENFDSISYCADIHVHPSGKFLFASNRGHNSIAVFSINQQDGTLAFTGTFPCGGNWPRNFMVDPEGEFLFVANERSDNIAIHKIDQESGALMNTGKSLSVMTPVCIKRIIK